MADTTPDEEPLQGGSGSQALLWVIGIVALVAGFIALASSDAEAVGSLLVGVGGFGVMLALAVQAIRAALK